MKSAMPTAADVLEKGCFEVKSIEHKKLTLPRRVPVMVLPTLLFPNSLLPLHIFEPRYRAMLTTALEEGRMFCIALSKRGIDEWTSPKDFHHIAGLGLVRACVGRDDGTSHLILQGLARVKLTKFVQEEPFPIAHIRELASLPAEDYETESLAAKLLSVCARMRENGHGVPATLDQQLAQIENPDVLADVVAHTFLRDPFRRQDVFEELRVGERLRLLIRHLSAESI
jgi:Lon protease-like protein